MTVCKTAYLVGRRFRLQAKNGVDAAASAAALHDGAGLPSV